MGDFIRDYGALIAPTAAILNGFVAVVIAQFFKEHLIAKIILVVVVGLLGAAAIGATIHSQRQIVADKLAETRRHAAEVQRRTADREQLGSFIAEGETLTLKSMDANYATLEPEVTEWAQRVLNFLRDHLGQSYVSRALSPAGVPVGIAPRVTVDEKHTQLFRIVNGLIVHLEAFSQEMNSAAVR
jgi:hypothetical protein